MPIAYSAPQPFILGGEYSVLYGKPMLVCALADRVMFHLHEKKEAQSKDANFQFIENIQSIVYRYLKAKNLLKNETDYVYTVTSPYAPSVAALGVAATAAFLHWYSEHEFDKTTISQLAHQARKKVDRNDRGVETTAACFGGLIYYRKEFEFLKTISLLQAKLPAVIQKHLYFIDTNNSIVSIVETEKRIGKQYNANPQHMDQLMNSWEKVVKRMVMAVVKEDPHLFAQAFAEEENIQSLFVEPSELFSQLKTLGVGKSVGENQILFFTDKEKEMEIYLQKRSIQYRPFKGDWEGVKLIV